MADDKDFTQMRSIPFSGGRQDDVEEFSQESPTMSEATNVRYRKAGQVEKSLPFEEVLNDHAVIPSIISTAADNLFAVDTGGTTYVHEEGETTWHTSPSRMRPAVNEPIHNLPAASGGGNYSFAEDSTYRMVAYERRIPNYIKDAPPTVEVVCELYDLATLTLVDRAVNAPIISVNPQCINPGGGLCCYFVDAANAISYFRVESGALALNATGITDCLLLFPNTGVATTVTDIDLYRIGHCEDGSVTGLFVVTGNPNAGGGSGQGIIAWKSTPGNSIQTQRLNSSGVLVSSPATALGSNAGCMPLDISMDDNNNVAIIYGFHSEPAGTWTFTVQGKTGLATGSPTWDGARTLVSGNGTVINGSCAVLGDDAWFAATTVHRNIDTDMPTDVDEDSRVTFGTFDSASQSTYQTIYHHRLASQAVKNPFATSLLCVVQQWTSMEPRTTTVVPTFLPVHLKGVTSVLVDVSSSELVIWSAYDAGQSRAMHTSGAEQNTHLPNLYLASSGFRYINRVQLQPEDIFHIPTGVDSSYNKRTASMYGGEARGVVYETKIGTDLDTPLTAERVGQNAIINTAVPSSFDGVALGELSPLDQPEIVVYRQRGGTPTTHIGWEVLSTIPDQTRTVQVVCGYSDANGQLHRSAPSFPLFVEGNVDAISDGTELWRRVGWTLPLTAYVDRPYFFEIYIGQGANEPQLAAVLSRDLTPYSHTDAETVLIDSFISTIDPVRHSETIYTAGNVLAADAWPNFDDFVVTSNRLFAIGDANKGTIFYSKLFEENIAPEFSASLVIPLGRSRTLQAAGKVDDKVLIFTEDEVFAIYDTGPDNTGANGDFIVDRLQTAFGCTDPRSILEIPEGLCFYSSRSQQFHIITHDLQIVDIGRPIQDASQHITGFHGGVVVPDEHELRWYCEYAGASEFGPAADTGAGIPPRPARPRFEHSTPANQGALVYNYQYRKWSTQSPSLGGAYTLWVMKDGRPNALTSAFSHYRETKTNWTTAEEMMVETPWVRIANLQTYGRVDELIILGKYLSAWNDANWGGGKLESGDIQVDLWYDYEASATPSDTYRYRANRGDLGNENTSDRMQLSVHPGKPKCQAIKVRVTEIPTTAVEVSEPTYGAGQGFALTGMDIVFEPKRGTGSKTLSQQRGK